MVVARCFTETQRKTLIHSWFEMGCPLVMGGWLKGETFLFNQRSAWLCFLNWVKELKIVLISTVKKNYP